MCADGSSPPKWIFVIENVMWWALPGPVGIISHTFCHSLFSASQVASSYRPQLLVRHSHIQYSFIIESKYLVKKYKSKGKFKTKHKVFIFCKGIAGNLTGFHNCTDKIT